jgi:hypothetical protein
LVASLWFRYPQPPLPRTDIAEAIARQDSAFESLCKQLVVDVKIEERAARQADCQSRLRTEAERLAEQSLLAFRNEHSPQRRITLILLCLVVVLPFFLASVRLFKRAPEESKALWLTVCCVFVLLFLLLVVSIGVWNQPDKFIAYVPVPILEWGFAGGMLAVIHRISFTQTRVSRLMPWVVARPLIGMFMGAAVYFIALAIDAVTSIKLSGDPKKQLALNSIVFVAAFNDKFARATLGKVGLHTTDPKD